MEGAVMGDGGCACNVTQILPVHTRPGCTEESLVDLDHMNMLTRLILHMYIVYEEDEQRQSRLNRCDP